MENQEISQAERLDQRVVHMVPGISRAFGTKLINDGRVRVNGEPQIKAGYKMREDDVVEVDFDITEHVKVPEIELPVLYEDDDCVVIDKPVGVLSHSKGAFNPEATVATWLKPRLKDLAGERAGIVHRLDRATSGVMICAKTSEGLSKLQKQFSQRKAKKTYYAVVSGRLPHNHAVIDMPIERNPKHPQRFRVGSGGKPALTEYFVKEAGEHRSLIELRPQTGRTHQLRVHMQQLGHPIVGDTFYDGPPAKRLYLHAVSLEITLPNRERRVFEAPLPLEFETEAHA